MGLSSKQVNSDGLDWSRTLLQAQVLEPPKPAVVRRQQQPNQPQQEPLKCPRCDSTNTKFCYYNNYNRSQPRHFCKTCKRHWTKGGTLRNVPVGGGRKYKKPKPSKLAAAASGGSQKQSRLPLYQGVIASPSNSVFRQNNSAGLDSKSFYPGSGSDFSLPPQQNQGLNFSYSSANNCLMNSIPIPAASSGFYNYNNSSTGEAAMEDSTITTSMPISTSSVVPHQGQTWNSASAAIDMASYNWNWDEMDSLVSTTDLNIAWDDSDQISKP